MRQFLSPATVLHGLAIVAVFGTFTVVSGLKDGLLQGFLTDTPVIADIAIEHTTPLSLRFSISKRNGHGLIEVNHDGNETVHVSLPEEWQRSTVRNASLDAVGNDGPMLGFRRWQIPAGAAVEFKTTNAPENLLIHNPSHIPLEIKYTLVDLETEAVESNVVLIKDDGVLLW